MLLFEYQTVNLKMLLFDNRTVSLKMFWLRYTHVQSRIKIASES